MRKASGIVRLLAAASGILALVAHLLYSLGSGGSALSNFFSYFTMQSAIVAVLLWSVGGVVALRSRVDPRWLVTARLLATTYQLVSGAVYTIIVFEAISQEIPIQVPASTQVLHYWLPAYALLDWLFAPGRGRVRWRVLDGVLVFPLLWGIFTMIRGAQVRWYPYFFLDPYQVSGPWQFSAYSAAVLTFILVVAAGLIASSRLVPRTAGNAVSESRLASESRLGSEEGFEAPARSLDEFVVTQIGDRESAFAADEAYENR